MSVFFFRLHNLRREEENKKRKKANSSSAGESMQQVRRSIRSGRQRYRNALAVKPSRMFEKTPLSPCDSLDEIALQIP
ncbi:hypothetical protein Cfor_09064, partial [Coptotermes formosanus]